MLKSAIHPSVFIEEGAVIGEGVTIEPFVVIKKHVKIGDNVTIMSHSYIEGHTTIGEGTKIYPGVAIGCDPQALKYNGEVSTITIGKNCLIREYVTINSSLGEGAHMSIGDNCMIMAYCHLAHNSTLGKGVIMSNGATLAGHCEVGDYAIIGGKTPIHQFVRIGAYAMVGGFSRVGHDILPYTIGGGIPYRLGGLNLIGLKRHNFPLATRQQLSKAFRTIYRSGLKLEEALKVVESECDPIPEIQNWLQFCRSSKRGLICLGEKDLFENQGEGPYLEETR